VEYAQEDLGVGEDSIPEGAERPPGDPGVDELFGVSVYERGALTLHALRLTVGDDAFFRILREWVSRYRYENATTEDFIALTKELAGNRLPQSVDHSQRRVAILQQEFISVYGSGAADLEIAFICDSPELHVRRNR
jgi:hypothetical protein